MQADFSAEKLPFWWLSCSDQRGSDPQFSASDAMHVITMYATCTTHVTLWLLYVLPICSACRNTDAISPEEPGSSLKGYHEGISIKTGLPREAVKDDYFIGYNYRLTLPQRSLSGQCTWSAPVQFLTDTDETCVSQMSVDLCSESSKLSALMYAQSKAWHSSQGPLVLERQGDKSITVTDINYYCINQDEMYLGRYVHSVDKYKDKVSDDQVYLFNYDLPMNEFNETDCSFDPVGGAYVCGNDTLRGDLPQLPPMTRCSWDDGFTKPLAPAFNASALACENAVVDVLYSFTWSGQSVVELSASIVLATLPLTIQQSETVTTTYVETVNVSLGGGAFVTENVVRTQDNVVNLELPANFTQRFKVEFHHQIGENITASPGDEENSNATARPRSGKPGQWMDPSSCYNLRPFFLIFIKFILGFISRIWARETNPLWDSLLQSVQLHRWNWCEWS